MSTMFTSLTPRTKFYLTYSYTEAKKHKCHTCLGICSVFIVVVIAALCYTLVDNAPVVFLREAEQIYGQYDVLILPNIAPFLNYTLVSSILNQHKSSFNNHSPRLLYNQTSTFLHSTSCYNDTKYNKYNSNGCTSSITNTTSCLQNQYQLSFWLIDFNLENSINFGRNFNNLNNAPNGNEIILYKPVADYLGLKVGDITYLQIPLNSIRVPLFQNYLHTLNINDSQFEDILYKIQYECTVNVIPVQISYISDDKSLGGKFSESSTKYHAVMDISSFINIFIDNLPPNIKQQQKRGVNPYDFVNRVYVNIGNNRVLSYLHTNYQDIQSIFVGFASRISYYIGFTEINLSLDILRELEIGSYTMLMLGMIFNVIIFVLIILSILLLWSLLVISVETKTFSLGIFRMLGMSRKHLILLLETQSFIYALPAYIIGLICAQLGSIYVLTLLGSSSSINLDKKLTSTSIIIATIIGLGIDLIASILPIKRALGVTLQSSLDIHHSQTSAVSFNISRSDSHQFKYGLFSVCCVLVLYGWTIFYFFPQSIISGNLQLFGIILFTLMLSILCGCVLYGSNIQHLLSRLTVFITISWWEKRPIPDIVIKNLVAHRIRNLKTSIMYAFSLAFIFFVTVMISTNLEIRRMHFMREYGVKIFCWTYKPSLQMQNILQNINYIDDFTWKPGPIWGQYHSNTFHVSYTETHSIGRYFKENTNIIPTTSNFDNVVNSEYIVPVRETSYDYKQTTMGHTEQLFTAYGSQRGLIGEHIVNRLSLNSINDNIVIWFADERGDGAADGILYKYLKIRTCEWFSLFPFYTLRARHSNSNPAEVVIPISAMPRIFTGIESIEDLWITAVLIKFKSSTTNSEIDITKHILREYCFSIKDYRTISKEMSEAQGMLDLIFSFMTYCALFLCLFSLISSMFANIMEQSKEIAIFRSMGLTKFDLNKIYIYEALIIILSSSGLGFCVGYIVSWIIVQQQKLFSQYPIDLVVPTSVIFAVITGAIGTSVVSVYFPLRLLNKKQIAQNMRDITL